MCGVPIGPVLARQLTAREAEVLTLLSEGSTAWATARRLQVSPATVRKHLEHLYRELEVQDRLSAGNRGRELGLGARDVRLVRRGAGPRDERPEPWRLSRRPSLAAPSTPRALRGTGSRVDGAGRVRPAPRRRRATATGRTR